MPKPLRRDLLIDPATPVRSDRAAALGGEIRCYRNDANQLCAEGYLVRFSESPDEVDTYGTFFDGDTFYGGYVDSGAKLPIYFHHGFQIEAVGEDGNPVRVGPGKKHIGDGSITRDSTGLFLSAVLSEAGEYEADMQTLIDAGVLGWSSGSASHVVRYEPIFNEDGTTLRSWRVASWPLTEGSLTHTPAEYRNKASIPVRLASLATLKLGKDNAPDASLAARMSALGEFGDYWYGTSYAEGDEWIENIGASIHGSFTWRLCDRLECALDNIFCDDDLDQAAKDAAIRACFDEGREIAVKVGAMLSGLMPEDESEETIRAAVGEAFARYLNPEDESKLAQRAGDGSPVTGLSMADQIKNAKDGVLQLVARMAAITATRGTRGPNPTHITAAKEIAEMLRPLTGEPVRTGAPTPAENLPPDPAPTPVPARLAPDTIRRLESLRG